MNLEELRKEIDSIDNKIIGLLGKRKDLIKKVSAIKKELNKPVIDKNREQQIIERIRKLSSEKGLDEDFVASLYDIIIKNSRNEQENNV